MKALIRALKPGGTMGAGVVPGCAAACKEIAK